MIPTIIFVASVVGCGNNDSSPPVPLTVEQRRAAIDGAMAHLDDGRTAEALAITTTLVERDPKSTEAQETHALVLVSTSLELDKAGEPTKARDRRLQALQAYEIACAESTDAGLLQLSTAQLAHMLQEIEIAHKYYELAHNSVPSDGRAAFFLTQIHLLEKEWDQAQYWIGESLQRDPYEPFALLSSALVEAELGNIETSNRLATQGCNIRPNDASLRFMQARVVRLNGNPMHALEILASLPKDIRESPLGQDERQLCLAELKAEIE